VITVFKYETQKVLNYVWEEENAGRSSELQTEVPEHVVYSNLP